MVYVDSHRSLRCSPCRAAGRGSRAKRLREISHPRDDRGPGPEQPAAGALAAITVILAAGADRPATTIAVGFIASPTKSCFPSAPELLARLKAVLHVQRPAVNRQSRSCSLMIHPGPEPRRASWFLPDSRGFVRFNGMLDNATAAPSPRWSPPASGLREPLSCPPVPRWCLSKGLDRCASPSSERHRIALLQIAFATSTTREMIPAPEPSCSQPSASLRRR